MRILVLVLSSLYISNSYAIFQQIYSGYKVSNRLEEKKLQENIDLYDYKFNKLQNNWNLSLGLDYSDSFLQSIYSFSSTQTVTEKLTMGVQKKSFNYGTFSFGVNTTKYDLSNSDSSSTQGLSNFDEDFVYETRGSISYSYDFLNRASSVDEKLIEFQNKANIVKYEIDVEKDHYDFFNAYLDAKLRIRLEQLYFEFEARAKRRVELVKRRVRDGLSRSVDLTQSRLALISQKEQITQNRAILMEKVSIIEKIIGFKFKEEDYKKVYWTFKPSEQFKYIEESPRFKELERLKHLNALADENLNKIKELSGSSLNLTLTYTKNAFDEEANKALNETLSSGVNDEAVVGLQYIIPIGSSKTDAIKNKILAQRNKQKVQLKNAEDEVEVRTTILKDNINRYESLINLTKQRVELARLAQKQTQDLYLKGRVSFEETLRAEETFINTQVSLVNMLSVYEKTLVSLAYLNSKTIPFLEQYRD